MPNSFKLFIAAENAYQAQQWQDISPDINSELEAVLVDDAQHFMISGDASYRTSDGGATWSPLATAPNTGAFDWTASGPETAGLRVNSLKGQFADLWYQRAPGQRAFMHFDGIFNQEVFVR